MVHWQQKSIRTPEKSIEAFLTRKTTILSSGKAERNMTRKMGLLVLLLLLALALPLLAGAESGTDGNTTWSL